MPRTIVQDKRSKKKKQAIFLQYLIEFVSITRAAKKAKIGRQTVYDWVKNDQEFKPLYEAATEIAIEKLEDEAIRRANEGVVKPVYQGGKKVGSIREFSDTLLIFLLKGKKPDVYKDRFSGEIKNTGEIRIIEIPNNGRNNKTTTRIPGDGAKQPG